ncbi:MAG: hypothetical protein LBP22_01295 [Deltaproteobacteria bacterium]|jgi:hypothetical protein|nr:hypothetical protein [Deltaproteobacteria bacterium]
MPLNFWKKICPVFVLGFLLLACAPKYEYRAVPTRAIESYRNLTEIGYASIAAEALADGRQLTDTFGFDLKAAGVQPVRLLIQNDDDVDLTILAGSTLTDARGQIWELLPQNVVFDRIDRHTGGSSFEEGAGRTVKGAVIGAILGAAVGVATGTNVGSAVGKGAAVGGAIGASSAILGIGMNDDKSGAIVRDFSDMAIKPSSVAPGESVRGFLFFPGESDRPVKLNLKVKIGKQKTQRLALAL